jgi:hypothetical protein
MDEKIFFTYYQKTQKKGIKILPSRQLFMVTPLQTDCFVRSESEL